jgi:hypothetical protein
LSKIYEYIAANNGRSLLSDLNVNFDIPQGSAIDNLIDFFGLQTAQQTAPQAKQSISSSSGPGTTATGTQDLDSALAIDTLVGDDAIYQELAKRRNT